MLATLVLALSLLALSAGIVGAAPMGTAFTYQGRLLDSNDVADGLYDFAFSLFDDPSAGAQQGSTIDLDDVDVIDGYFTVALDFGDVFTGPARWLEIDVRPGASIDGNDFDKLIPRQENTPTPYAIYSKSAGDANTVGGFGAGELATRLHVHFGEDIIGGIVGTDYYSAFSDLLAEGYLGNTVGDLAQNNSVLQKALNADYLDSQNESAFFRLAQNEVVTGRPTFNGGVSGSSSPFMVDSTFRVPLLNADYLDGLHSTAFAGSAHVHNYDASYVNVTGDTMTGKLNMNTTGSSINVVSNPTAGTIYGVRVNADQSAANNSTIYGLYSDTDSAASTASIYGTYSNATGNGTAYGLYGYANSAARSPFGLYAYSTIPSSASSNIYASYGLYGITYNYGTGTTYGGSHISYQNGTSGTSYGTYSYTRGSDTGNAYGIWGQGYKQASDTSGTAYGGYFTGDNDSSGNTYGIYSRAIGTGGGTNYGVYGYASGGTTNYGIWAYGSTYAGYFDGTVVVDSGGTAALAIQLKPDGYASNPSFEMRDDNNELKVRIIARETSTTEGAEMKMYDEDGTNTIELDAEFASDGGGYLALRNGAGTTTITLDSDYSGDGRITTEELRITGGSDLSEQFDIRGAQDTVKPGMLVSIDPKRAGKLMVSSSAYDKKVAGIISGAGGVKPGMMMGQEGSEADGDYPVALTGRVYCWADASNGAIEPGDLLTTSSTPGHAMKVSNHNKALGAIIGKAMTSLEEDKGLVLVLVSLQ